MGFAIGRVIGLATGRVIGLAIGLAPVPSLDGRSCGFGNPPAYGGLERPPATDLDAGNDDGRCPVNPVDDARRNDASPPVDAGGVVSVRDGDIPAGGNIEPRIDTTLSTSAPCCTTPDDEAAATSCNAMIAPHLRHLMCTLRPATLSSAI